MRWTETTEAEHGSHENDSLLPSKSNEKSVKCFKKAGDMIKFAF